MSSKEGMPKIRARQEVRLSPWVRLVTKEVEFEAGKVEIYHVFAQSDYVAILAKTQTGLIPIVRQYRPAIEDYTYELPAGLVEDGESPEDTCRRELLEETGLHADSIVSMGKYWADTGRMENRLHSFFVLASEPAVRFIPEPGMSVEFVRPDTLRRYIVSGKFRHQLHIGVLSIADLLRPGWDV